jgi:anti-anti-sigma regulatory factor
LAARKPAFRCDVSDLDCVDIGAVGALARVALCLRRDGFDLRLTGASPELRRLIALAGLARILACDDPPEEGSLSRGAPAARTSGRTAPYRGRT